VFLLPCARRIEKCEPAPEPVAAGFHFTGDPAWGLMNSFAPSIPVARLHKRVSVAHLDPPTMAQR